MDTLFNESKDTMPKPIGNNYSVLFVSRYNVAVYQAGRFLKQVNIYDQFDTRLFVIYLIERHGATKSKVADALGISRTSVDLWLALYRSGGQKALINSTRKRAANKTSNGREKEITRPEGDKYAWEKAHKEERKKEETGKQEGKGDMLGMIIDKSKEYAPYIGNMPPLFIADKEIWGVEKFLLLADCRFVTWEKNTDAREINKLPESVFSPPFNLNGTIKAAEGA